MHELDFDKDQLEELKTLVIARLETLNQNSKIVLMGKKDPISVRDMIEEVKKDSELGKKIIKVQYSYLKMLANSEI